MRFLSPHGVRLAGTILISKAHHTAGLYLQDQLERLAGGSWAPRMGPETGRRLDGFGLMVATEHRSDLLVEALTRSTTWQPKQQDRSRSSRLSTSRVWPNSPRRHAQIRIA